MKLFYLIAVFLIVNLCFTQSKPELYLPEITKQFPNVRDIAMSPIGDEVLFTAQSVMGNLSAIIIVKKINGIWNEPEVASFSGQFFDLEPFFSPDGLTLYFVSTRPVDNSLKPKDFDIWFVKRSNLNSEWSKPKNLGAPINTEYGEFYPSIAENGNFYFTRDDTSKNRKDDIYMSSLINGNYQEPIVLSDAINSNSYEYNAFIAPDESYLIFGGYDRADGLGSGDLYISYKTDSDWTTAENMGARVNSDKMDYCPLVKNDTLYFTSKRDHTNVIQEQSLDITRLLKEFNMPDNGSSRLYSVTLELHKKH